MRVAVPRESKPGEHRVALLPETVKRLRSLGAEVSVEAGLGTFLGFTERDYTEAGAQVVEDRCALLGNAEVVVRVNKPPLDEIALMRRGTVHISLLDPFNERPLIDRLVEAGLEAVALELIPRSTIAQKMDVLSSQASLGGYVAVILAASRLAKIFPMMVTPAGTISPTRVFIIGAGVAGLQAIATAKRLGARVEAFDTRPVVEEQVQSLGAKFVKLDLGETGQTKDGYATALSEEQLQRQRELLAKHCALADVVITTAQVFGRKAPLIVTDVMLAGMRPGSVVVDLAVETGGNVEGVVFDAEVERHGVLVLGVANLPGRVAVHASQMFANNVVNFLEHFWDKQNKSLNMVLEDDIIRGALVAHAGALYSTTLSAMR